MTGSIGRYNNLNGQGGWLIQIFHVAEVRYDTDQQVISVMKVAFFFQLELQLKYTVVFYFNY